MARQKCIKEKICCLTYAHFNASENIIFEIVFQWNKTIYNLEILDLVFFYKIPTSDMDLPIVSFSSLVEVGFNLLVTHITYMQRDYTKSQSFCCKTE